MSYLVHRRWKENVVGYACPDSESRALKIWYVADAWQRLVVGGDSPQSMALPTVIRRMTGCKETTNFQSCADFGSSSTSVC